MSSDESGRENGIPTKFVSVQPWRIDFSDLYEVVDSHRFNPEIFSQVGTGPLRRVRDYSRTSKRKEVKGLPLQLYNPTWIKANGGEGKIASLEATDEKLEWPENRILGNVKQFVYKRQ